MHSVWYEIFGSTWCINKYRQYNYISLLTTYFDPRLTRENATEMLVVKIYVSLDLTTGGLFRTWISTKRDDTLTQTTLCLVHRMKIYQFYHDKNDKRHLFTESLAAVLQHFHQYQILLLNFRHIPASTFDIYCNVDLQVKVCSRETHSPSRASKICKHKAFEIAHIHMLLLSTVVAVHATLLNTAHTVGLRCGANLGADCSYNPGWYHSHPTVSKMT